VRHALTLTAANDAAVREWTFERRHDRTLALTIAAVEVQHDPVVRSAESVRRGRVREQRRVLPIAASGV
jgi:hypothetical protein